MKRMTASKCRSGCWLRWTNMLDMHSKNWVLLAGHRVFACARMDDFDTEPDSARLKLLEHGRRSDFAAI